MFVLWLNFENIWNILYIELSNQIKVKLAHSIYTFIYLITFQSGRSCYLFIVLYGNQRKFFKRAKNNLVNVHGDVNIKDLIQKSQNSICFFSCLSSFNFPTVFSFLFTNPFPSFDLNQRFSFLFYSLNHSIIFPTFASNFFFILFGQCSPAIVDPPLLLKTGPVSEILLLLYVS